MQSKSEDKGQIIGYCRVSTSDQHVENQKNKLSTYNIEKWFIDNGVSGTIRTTVRKQFSEMMAYLREGDTLVTTAIDRLGRNSIDIQQTIEELKERGVNIIIADLGIDLNGKGGKILISIMSAVAEMEREQMLERQKVGIARAQAEGKYKGRKSTLDHKAIVEYRQNNSIAATAAHFEIGAATVKRIQKAVKEKQEQEQSKQVA